ncbi:MAG TPA: HD domain-containing phosphohydrolase [Longimicrobiales bacterium]|nr:HD domain-containing phosphohydrolase [Longimicrobiales bacterium]
MKRGAPATVPHRRVELVVHPEDGMLEPNGSAPARDAPRVLIVDSDEFSASAIESALRQNGFSDILAVTDPRLAVPEFEAYQPDIVLVDARLTGSGGPDIVRRLRALEPAGRFLPVVLLSGDVTPELRRNAVASSANDFISKPFDAVELTIRLNNLLRLREVTHDLDDRAEEGSNQLRAAEVDLANRLAIVAEYRDYPDGAHVQRVGRLSAILAERLDMADSDLAVIRFAAPLHDIGKIAIPDSILLKPAPLTLDELDIMKSHTTIGARMLADSDSPILRMAEEIALYHHENWDGTGYTPGVRGDAIPLCGRIVAVADVFDALTHSRPYKRAWSMRETIEWIVSVRERKFDPAVVDALTNAMDEIEAEPALSDEWSTEYESVEPLPSL